MVPVMKTYPAGACHLVRVSPDRYLGEMNKLYKSSGLRSIETTAKLLRFAICRDPVQSNSVNPDH